MWVPSLGSTAGGRDSFSSDASSGDTSGVGGIDVHRSLRMGLIVWSSMLFVMDGCLRRDLSSRHSRAVAIFRFALLDTAFVLASWWWLALDLGAAAFRPQQACALWNPPSPLHDITVHIALCAISPYRHIAISKRFRGFDSIDKATRLRHRHHERRTWRAADSRLPASPLGGTLHRIRLSNGIDVA
jgi:hypothetical protein